MRYFDGMEWVAHNHLPRCRVWVDKRFPDYYVLNYADAGFVTWRAADGVAEVLSAPVAWVCYPGPRFRYGSRDGTPWDHRFVSFRGDRVAAYLEGGLLPGPGRAPFWPIRDRRRFVEAFDELCAALEDVWGGADRAVHRLEGLLLSRFDAPRPGRAGTRIERGGRELAERVAGDVAREWDFQREAGRLGMSYTHFRRTFSAVAGRSPRQYLIAKRLEFAARRLRQGNEPVKAVAARSGYPDLYYFTRAFRQRYGLPPARYRRQAQSP